MFCPTCGRENSRELKFCASCGTNLAAVSQALSGVESEGFLSRIDSALDQFIGRYAERIFKDASLTALDRGIAKSWKLFGQGVITLVVDLFLLALMWNVLPLRLIILLISTPIRLLSGRSQARKRVTAELGGARHAGLPEPSIGELMIGSAGSVTEHTTERLPEYLPPKQEQGLKAGHSE